MIIIAKYRAPMLVVAAEIMKPAIETHKGREK